MNFRSWNDLKNKFKTCKSQFLNIFNSFFHLHNTVLSSNFHCNKYDMVIEINKFMIVDFPGSKYQCQHWQRAKPTSRPHSKSLKIFSLTDALFAEILQRKQAKSDAMMEVVLHKLGHWELQHLQKVQFTGS